MMRMDDREWNERMELFSFIGALPWEWFFINRLRRREGLPPLRYRQAVVRLLEMDRPRVPGKA